MLVVFKLPSSWVALPFRGLDCYLPLLSLYSDDNNVELLRSHLEDIRSSKDHQQQMEGREKRIIKG